MHCFKKSVCVKIASSIMPGVKMLRQNFVSAFNKSPKDKRLKILNLSHFLENLEFFMTFYICCTKHMPTFRAQFHKINLVVTFQFLSFPEIFQTSFSKQVRTFLLSTFFSSEKTGEIKFLLCHCFPTQSERDFQFSFCDF